MPSDAHQSGLHHAMAFGCRWQSDLPLPAFEACAPHEAADLTVHLKERLDQSRGIPCGNRIVWRPDGIRLLASTSACFDQYEGNQIDVVPADDWQGGLPREFYSTFSAATMAYRGHVPLHGSAVWIQGRTVLLCGPSGAGKSTLAAALIAAGGLLISDDLSVLHVRNHSHVELYLGRKGIRLFPDLARLMEDRVPMLEPTLDAKHKRVIHPPRVPADVPFHLDTLVLLGDSTAPIKLSEAGDTLIRQMYRGKAMRRGPGYLRLVRACLLTAAQVRLLRHSRVQARSGVELATAAASLLAIL